MTEKNMSDREVVESTSLFLELVLEDEWGTAPTKDELWRLFPSASFKCLRTGGIETFRPSKSSVFNPLMDHVWIGEADVVVVAYRCSGCNFCTYTIVFQMNGTIEEIDTRHYRMTKIASVPARRPGVPRKIKKYLGDDLGSLYSKALYSEQYGQGIGALVYYRRVLEALTFKLVEDLSDETHREEWRQLFADNNDKPRQEEIIDKATQVFADEFAERDRDIFQQLYSGTSFGLHALGDEAALKLASAARLGLEALIESIIERQDRDKRLRQSRNLINQAKKAHAESE